ncbi:MAG: CoA pyrophosphatase [Pseudomonadota bacterium]
MKLSPAAIRHILDRASSAGPRIDHLRGDEGHQELGHTGTIKAAVLIALVNRPVGATIVLTKRTSHLRAHAGQISFPGGRMEPDDVSAYATALREAKEEIGLMPVDVEILGTISPYSTITGFKVYPIVGWVSASQPFRPDPFEVDEVFEVPLEFVLNQGNHQRESRIRHGRRRHYYVLSFEGRYIWGATAAMLVNFARLIGHYGSDAPAL